MQNSVSILFDERVEFGIRLVTCHFATTPYDADVKIRLTARLLNPSFAWCDTKEMSVILKDKM
jgi:hypothetical protein